MNHQAISPSPRFEYHAAEAVVVLERLGTGAQGLTPGAAAERLEQFGPNRLSEHKGRGPLIRLLLQFHNVLICGDNLRIVEVEKALVRASGLKVA